VKRKTKPPAWKDVLESRRLKPQARELVEAAIRRNGKNAMETGGQLTLDQLPELLWECSSRVLSQLEGGNKLTLSCYGDLDSTPVVVNAKSKLQKLASLLDRTGDALQEAVKKLKSFDQKNLMTLHDHFVTKP
jgi:hypothetical protein